MEKVLDRNSCTSQTHRMAGQQREQFPAWVRSPEQTAAHYGVSLEVGLSSEQVEEARRKYGWNELEKAPGKPLWKLVLEQFDDMLVKVSACIVPSLHAWNILKLGLMRFCWV